MFKTFINAFKVKDVRRKIFYVLMTVSYTHLTLPTNSRV